MPAPQLDLDFSKEETPAQILLNLPILSSHQSSWQSIHLAHQYQPPWELPEMSSAQHIECIPVLQASA
jgi:hypothetical protein